MRVVVRLFASLVSFRPGTRSAAPFEVELPDSATLGEALDCVGVPLAEAKVVFVNGRARAHDWRLEPGDQLGIFPSIGGG